MHGETMKIIKYFI